MTCLSTVAACDLVQGLNPAERPSDPAEAASDETRPEARPVDLTPPPANATTAEEFDTTTQAERTAAVAQAQSSGGARDLGVTIASLGAVTEPGIWIKTPLVRAPGKGRVDYPAKGTSVSVDLLPLDGDPGAGSRLSLAAMRLLEADLTGLPEVRVFSTGS